MDHWCRLTRFHTFIRCVVILLLMVPRIQSASQKSLRRRGISNSSKDDISSGQGGVDFISKFFPDDESSWLGPKRPRDQQTAYACEQTPLEIQCDADKGEVIRIIRANYGRFSITICNPHGITEGWNLQCMSMRSLKIVSDRCDGWTRCKIMTNNGLFGDPCPDTFKYLQVQYRCAKEAPSSTRRTTTTQTTTTTETLPPFTHTTSFVSPLITALYPTTTTTTPSIPTHQETPQPTPTTSQTSLSTIQNNPSNPYTGTQSLATQTQGANSSSTTAPPTTAQPTTVTTTASTTTTSTKPFNEPSGGTTPSQGPIPIELTYCNARLKDGVNWPRTNVGIKALLDCPGDLIGVITWDCSKYGWVGSPDDGNCKSAWLKDVIEEVESRSPVEEVMKDIEDKTSKHILKSADLKITAKIMNKMVERIAVEEASSEAMKTTADEMVHTMSNLLATKQRESWSNLEQTERTKVATSLVISVEDTAFALANTVDVQMTANENILVEVNVVKTVSHDLTLPSLVQSHSSWASNSDSITIPKESLEQYSQNGKVSVVFIAYNNLGEWMTSEASNPPRDKVTDGENKITDSDSHSSKETETSPSWMVNTKIISTSLNNRAHTIPLTKPVTFVLQHNNESFNLNPKCAYWNYSDTTKLGHWAEDGCRLVGNNKTHTTCQCDHLTNFAVLMDVAGTMLPAHHELSLQVITYAGCLVSIFCLILAFITFFIFKNLQCDRNTIHKNLVLSLLIAESIFLAGIQQSETPILCSVIAGLLHFFFLASFAWMCLEGIQLYVMLIEVFEAERSRVKWYYLFGYGVPAIIVGVSAAVDHQGYGTDKHCWLRTDTYFIWSFVGPVAAVITINIVMLSIAIYMMCRHTTSIPAIRTKDKNKLDKYRAWIKGAAVLVVLLGLTWSFGILYINENTVAMAYLFTILNSLQGLFIFVFHCLMNEKVQKEYRKVARRTSWLPECIRVKYGGYTGYSQSTTPNQSSSSGNNYFSKLWSGRKRKKSTSSLLAKSNSSPSRKRKSSRPISGSRDSSSVLTPLSNQNGFVYQPNIQNGDVKMPLQDHGGINGDLSVVDCSVVDSEFVSEYCRENMKSHQDTPKGNNQGEQTYNPDESIYHVYEEPVFKNKKNLHNSADSIIKNRLSFISTDTRDGIHYSEVSDDELFRMTEKDKRMSEYEREPLVSASRSERQLIEETGKQTKNSPTSLRFTQETSPSLSDLSPEGKSDGDEEKNLSTPNLKYKDTLPREEGEGGVSDPMLQPKSSLPNITVIDEGEELTFGSFDESASTEDRSNNGRKVKRLSSDLKTKFDPHRYKLNTSSDC